MSAPDLSQLSMLDLFRLEAENQTQTLTDGLLSLERDPAAPETLELCMRAAHSLKGAARLVDVDAGVALAHAMEDCFVAAQNGHAALGQREIDCLLRGVDLLLSIAKNPNSDPARRKAEVNSFVADLAALIKKAVEEAPTPPEPPAIFAKERATEPQSDLVPGQETTDRVLRVTVDNLNRLLGLAGESLVESRWLKPFGEQLLRLKREHQQLRRAADKLREALPSEAMHDGTRDALAELRQSIIACEQFLHQRMAELDASDRRSSDLAHRLYDEALACRMRPIGDGVAHFRRMVRDLGRSLGKQVRLEITGAETPVDRDILEKLDAPLGHILRNAVDHGIESAEIRAMAGKPAEAVLRLDARHSAGRLQIAVADDGQGIDLAVIRVAVVERGLTNTETAAKMSDSELLEFLFLPGFSMKKTVTEISGRGVGLDVVQDMIKSVRGSVHVTTEPGAGASFHLQLPLTLSVARTLLVEIGGEAYALPLSFVLRIVKVPKNRIEMLEGRQHFKLDDQHIGLVGAHQIFGTGEPDFLSEELPVVLLGDHNASYGLVVDRLLGRRELVVQPLDRRLGKIKDISAAALMEDGSPVLIIDVEDMIRSMEKLASTDRLSKVGHRGGKIEDGRAKRVLVVDDSLTVRELERKLLSQHGYNVEIAVDGIDGWNAVRTGDFDLVITDIDMPRMDGIELVTLIKKDPLLKSLHVMVVSYKDRDEDRRRGLDAGADYYLTKGSFHDDKLISAVVDLIGEAAA